jgi:hypothetical protein
MTVIPLVLLCPNLRLVPEAQVHTLVNIGMFHCQYFPFGRIDYYSSPSGAFLLLAILMYN